MCFDVCLHPSQDMSSPEFVSLIAYIISHFNVIVVWFGTPCASFSRARRGTPPPLRSQLRPLGLDGLSDADRRRVQIANRHLRVTCNLARCCFRHHVPFVIENHAFSYLWETPAFGSLKRATGASDVVTDFC